MLDYRFTESALRSNGYTIIKRVFMSFILDSIHFNARITTNLLPIFPMMYAGS